MRMKALYYLFQRLEVLYGESGFDEFAKVVAAMETAAKSNQVIETDVYRETHALYHAIMEALYG